MRLFAKAWVVFCLIMGMLFGMLIITSHPGHAAPGDFCVDRNGGHGSAKVVSVSGQKRR